MKKKSGIIIELTDFEAKWIYNRMTAYALSIDESLDRQDLNNKNFERFVINEVKTIESIASKLESEGVE